jgi:hypothetical protein
MVLSRELGKAFQEWPQIDTPMQYLRKYSLRQHLITQLISNQRQCHYLWNTDAYN